MDSASVVMRFYDVEGKRGEELMSIKLDSIPFLPTRSKITLEVRDLSDGKEWEVKTFRRDYVVLDREIDMRKVYPSSGSIVNVTPFVDILVTVEPA